MTDKGSKGEGKHRHGLHCPSGITCWAVVCVTVVTVSVASFVMSLVTYILIQTRDSSLSCHPCGHRGQVSDGVNCCMLDEQNVSQTIESVSETILVALIRIFIY